MKLSPKFLIYLALFHLALGLGWLLGHLLLPATMAVYESLAQERLNGQYDYVRRLSADEDGALRLQTYAPANGGQSADLPVISLHRSSVLNSFVAYPPVPMDYAVLFRHLYEQGAMKVYVSAPMVWDEEPDHIVKAAVDYELERFQYKALGLYMSESSRIAPLPESWQSLIIPAANISGDTAHFPRADKLAGDAHQLAPGTPTLPYCVENDPLFTQPQTGKSLPLFVRHGNDILPTLPLIAVMNALEISPADLRVIPGETLQLGDKRTVPLDENACTPLKADTNPTLLDTQEVIIQITEGIRTPDHAEVRKLLAGADAVLVAEPPSGADTPDFMAMMTAKTIRSIMAGLSPSELVTYACAPAWAQWILLIDALFLGLWAFRFSRPARLIIWGGSIAGLIGIAGYIFYAHGIWTPVMTPVCAILSLAVTGFLLRFAANNRDSADDDGDDEPPPARPTDEIFIEPKEVPIPHHSNRN